MPKGPNGEKRPADVIGNAVRVMQIATGEIDEDANLSSPHSPIKAAAAKRRAESMSPERRSEIASKAARAKRRARVDGEQ